MNLEMLLRTMIAKGASDLHLKAECFPHLRVNGELIPLVEFGKTSKQDTVMMAFSIMNNAQKQKFRDNSELDLSYSIPNLARFRVNVFQQKGSVSIAIRSIPLSILSFEDLHLPKVFEKIAKEPRGMVLVTGTTGSGKSTSIASMLHYINKNLKRHIITIEDPMEFVHEDQMSIVSQREISVDALSFSNGLRSALRQDPDVILVGEMRDLETIETALLAAETGHLVFSTLHTLDALETINRIIAVFPPNQQRQVRMQLAHVLRAVISMRLIKRSDIAGRVPAIEVMVVTEYVRNCILEPEKTRMIRGAIAAGTSQYGMQTFDQSIYEHYKAGRITYEDALEYASNPDEFKLRVQGIYSTTDTALESMERDLAGGNK